MYSIAVLPEREALIEAFEDGSTVSRATCLIEKNRTLFGWSD
jgi:hypothetical protein